MKSHSAEAWNDVEKAYGRLQRQTESKRLNLDNIAEAIDEVINYLEDFKDALAEDYYTLTDEVEN